MSECKYKNVCNGFKNSSAACIGKDEQINCGAYNNFSVVYIRQANGQ